MDCYGYSAAWLARACGVDASTARRWKRMRFVPARYRRLVELADGCDLGALSPAWRGWRLLRDELVNPEGERYLVDQVRALHLKAQLAAELERRLARIMEASPRRPVRELVFRVRIEEESQVPSAGGVTVEHLAHLQS